MRKFGLIGYPLSHSFSPNYFARKFQQENITDAEYLAHAIESIADFPELISPEHIGFNVTIPYKEQVMKHLTSISPEAEAVGAVNTVLIDGNNRTGYNSDVYGFRKSLIDWCGENIPDKALILGSGGACKAVKYVFDGLGVDYQTVSRKEAYLNYHELSSEIMAEYKLIVNTTPLGMSPHTDSCPAILYEALTAKHFLYDLIYNPEETLFMKNGKKHQAKVKNGYDMLILQAEKSWAIWNGIDLE